MRSTFRIQIAIIIFAGAFFQCKNDSKSQYKNLPEYNLNQPKTLHLKSELDEISGVTFYAKDTSVFAINDEVGILYKIYLRKQLEIVRWKFSEGGDFEDLALVDSVFYVLQSNGKIHSFKVITPDSVVTEEFKSPFSGKNDLETMYYDDVEKQLVVLCKDCKEDNKSTVTAWSFDPETKTFGSDPYYTLDGKYIKSKLVTKENKFKPSAAALNPVTKELYIIASVNKGLVIADRKGRIKKVLDIDPKHFKQPEGLTFTPNGDLIISNEGAEIGPGNLMIFKNKKLKKP